MRFYKVTVSGSFLPDVASTRSLGTVGSEFLEVHADGFFGDVKSDDGNSCLVNADVPANSTFLGTATAAKYSA